jgi:3-phenylpropionate/cinnamic acid dioxygenase small subunit
VVAGSAVSLLKAFQETTPMSMDDRITRLADRAEIWDILIGYASAVDLREWQRWASYLHEDIEISLGEVGSVKGREACRTFAEQALSDIGPTQHIITNPEIAIDEDQARVRAILTTLHTVIDEDGSYHSLQGFGFYHYVLVRSEDGWKIRRAEVQVLHSVGDPRGRAAAGAARR